MLPQPDNTQPQVAEDLCGSIANLSNASRLHWCIAHRCVLLLSSVCVQRLSHPHHHSSSCSSAAQPVGLDEAAAAAADANAANLVDPGG